MTIKAEASVAKRLGAIEQHLLEVEEITAVLRQYFDELAEMVHIAADEVGESRMTTRRVVIVNNAARWPPADKPRARAPRAAGADTVRH